jgi:DNA-binding CsgD family transcriptional regulator
VHASSGNLDAAIAHSQDLAVRLIDDTFFAHAAIALHDVVRFGRPEEVVAQLTRLVGLVEGPLIDVMARHARAAAGGDSDELLAVADSFGRLGLNLHGAEAAACAFSRLRELRSTQAAEATSVMASLLDRCEDSHTPGLIVDRPTLTAREAQIARLAAAGLTSKDIAGQLYLSARTIDNHLRRIYAKLGVSGRGELSGALSTVVSAG